MPPLLYCPFFRINNTILLLCMFSSIVHLSSKLILLKFFNFIEVSSQTFVTNFSNVRKIARIAYWYLSWCKPFFFFKKYGGLSKKDYYKCTLWGRGQKDAKLFTENLLQYSGERKSVARIAVRRRKRFRGQVLYWV